MNLLSTIKKSGKKAATGGILSVALLTGCESINDRQALGLLLGGMAPLSARPAAGQSLNFLGDALVSSDNADRSRSEVNVYQTTRQNSPVWESLDIYSCEWYDGNGDAMIQRKETRETDSFYGDRKAVIAMFSVVPVHYSVRTVISKEENVAVDINTDVLPVTSAGQTSASGVVLQTGKMENGDYDVKCFVGDNKVREFKIHIFHF